jgi:hypothetical protein
MRVCLEGQVVHFAVEPEQLRILDAVGALDRMEVVPLLSNRAVVFVENKSDRKLLEHFARKLWGEQKQREVWSQISFLHSYQDPVTAGVLNLARQVRDLLAIPEMARAQPLRFLAVGDRDYRTDSERRGTVRRMAAKARSSAYQLDLKLHIWEVNEIENFLLDLPAWLQLLDAQACRAGQEKPWSLLREAFASRFEELIAEQQEDVRQRLATRIQQTDRRLELRSALRQADEALVMQWGDGHAWCDAKRILSKARRWLQEQGLRCRLGEREIVETMENVPEDVKKALRTLRGLTSGRPRRAKA